MANLFREIGEINLRKIPKSARRVTGAGANNTSSTLTLPPAIKALMEVDTGDEIEFWHIPRTKLIAAEQPDGDDDSPF